MSFILLYMRRIFDYKLHKKLNVWIFDAKMKPDEGL